jgi:hypothetical protein
LHRRVHVVLSFAEIHSYGGADDKRKSTIGFVFVSRQSEGTHQRVCVEGKPNATIGRLYLISPLDSSLVCECARI